MRPLLRPGVGYVWRTTSQLQVGAVDPLACAPSVLISGVGPGAAHLLDHLDGTRDATAISEAATSYDLGRADVAAVLDELDRNRLVVDAEGAARSRPGRRPLVGLGVAVHGLSRVGALLASLLAAAGVGRVHVVGSGEVTAADYVPGGARQADLGRPRLAAVLDAVHSAGPGVRTHGVPGRSGVDCVVFADGARPDRQLVRTLTRAGTPHLYAEVDGPTGRVGPLVLPGRSACLGCLSRHRADVDPGWRLLRSATVDRVAGRTVAGGARDPTTVGLVALVAGLACGLVLELLAGQRPAEATGGPDETPPPPPAGPAAWTDRRGGVWEWSAESLEARRRVWDPHPECVCGAGRETRGEGTQ